MSKYIDSDKLIAEFQKRFDICKRISEDDKNALDTMDWYRGKYTAYSECLSFIASLQQEQQEVDLNEEVERFAKECGYKSAATLDFQFARHYYELG